MNHRSRMGRQPSAREIAAQVEAQVGRQVRAIVKKGYFAKEGGKLRLQAEYRDGALTINGRPGEPILAAFFQEAPLSPSLETDSRRRPRRP